jgi:protoheme IX farnesyltransferase
MKSKIINSFIQGIKNLASLCKFLLSLAIAFSSLAGYLIYTGDFSGRLLWLVLGVFFLSCGASSFNQYQERKTDALMSRTSGRPIPSGQISPRQALMVTSVLVIAGSILLYLVHPLCLFLGLFNMLWYNGVYTFLKYRSSFAVLTGSLSGAIPPVIGYAGAGGTISDPSILFVFLFMYLWQIPHFWLLFSRYKEDYEQSGLAVIIMKIPEYIFRRIILIWILATSIASLFFPCFGIITSLFSVITLIVLNIGIILIFLRIVFFQTGKPQFKTAFMALNAFMILVLLMVILR